MLEIDGHYCFAGAEVRWGREGVRLRRSPGENEVHVPWSDLRGAHAVGGGRLRVVLDVEGVASEHGGRAAAYALPVRSEPDAHRLVTQFTWYAGRGYPPAATALDEPQTGPLTERTSRALTRLAARSRPRRP